jgi:hypothetical protein
VQAKQTPQYLDLRTPGSAVTARVTPQGITSPELQLDVSPTTLRGRAFGRPVDLTLKQDQNSITGMYGMSPVNLRLKNNGVAIQANGMFAGQLSNLKLSKEELSGTVGRCSYQLKAKDQQYEGSRSCGFGLENPVSVSIPPALAQSNEQVIAALSVLLAQ